MVGLRHRARMRSVRKLLWIAAVAVVVAAVAVTIRRAVTKEPIWHEL